MEMNLKQRCRSLARTLDLRATWTVPDLASRLSALRGRPLHIEVLPHTRAGSIPCGLWVATETTDYIFVRQGASSLHHKHFVLHEVGHMVCGHQGLNIPNGLSSILPHLKPELIRRALARTTPYSTPQEREAEFFAGLLYHSSRQNRNERETDQLARRASGAMGIP
ncbi:putative regulator component [Mycolicibacterium phlei]|nr:putative regulator component [Mycolicibacterium phlei]